MSFQEKSEDEKPFGSGDVKNVVVSTMVYMFGSHLLKYVQEKSDPLFMGYTDLVYADTLQYLVIPGFMAYVVGLGIGSVAKPDRPFVVHALPGLCIAIATIVSTVNVLSPLSLEVGNVFSAGAAVGGYALGRKTRYPANQKDW